LVGGFAFADRHHAFVTDVSRDERAGDNENERQVQNQRGPLFLFVQLVALDVAKEIDHKKQHDGFEPSGVVDQYPRGIGVVFIFDKCSRSHRCRKSQEQNRH
jgi:hypothetical protein